jgi:hypothetical protein
MATGLRSWKAGYYRHFGFVEDRMVATSLWRLGITPAVHCCQAVS